MEWKPMKEREILMLNMAGKWEPLSENRLNDMMTGDFYGACGSCPIRISGIEKTADEWQKQGWK